MHIQFHRSLAGKYCLQINNVFIHLFIKDTHQSYGHSTDGHGYGLHCFGLGPLILISWFD